MPRAAHGPWPACTCPSQHCGAVSPGRPGAGHACGGRAAGNGTHHGSDPNDPVAQPDGSRALIALHSTQSYLTLPKLSQHPMLPTWLLTLLIPSG
jgi:hypothetical protein